MKVIRRVLPVILSAALLFSCDLFSGAPDRDIKAEIDHTVWLANQPNLRVRMEFDQGSGIANYLPGEINPQPKMEVPFEIIFSPNSNYGFVEWRAFFTANPERGGEYALGPGMVRFEDRENSTTSVTVLVKADITLVPFAVPRPMVATTLPPAGGTATPLVTNFPVEFWFSDAVDEESVNWDTVKIRGLTQLGGGSLLPDLSDCFSAPQGNGGGIYFRMEALGSGVPPSCNITITIGPGIRLKEYPVAMEKAVEINYRTGENPDLTPPLVEHIRASRDGATFLSGTFNAENYGLTMEEDERVIYLCFDAYKTNGSLRDIRITEEQTGTVYDGANPRPYRDYEILRDQTSVLSALFQDEFHVVPFVIRYVVQTPGEGNMTFFIQPSDTFGNRSDVEDARDKGYMVQAVIDDPPDPVANLSAVYYADTEKMLVSWTDPSNPDYVGVQIQALDEGNTQIAAEPVERGRQSYALNNISAGSGVYIINLWALDQAGNDSPVRQTAAEADGSAPVPVADLRASYRKEDGAILAEWQNPASAGFTVMLSWQGSNGRSGNENIEGLSSGSAGSHSIDDIGEDRSSYEISAKVRYPSNQESPALNAVVIADATPPGPVVNLRLSYDPLVKSIVARWINPADDDLGGTRISWESPLLPEGEVLVPAGQASYAIGGISGLNLDEYTLRVQAVDLAGNRSEERSGTVVADEVPPEVPGNLWGEFQGADSRIRVSWDNPVDPDLAGLRLSWGKLSQSVTTVPITDGRTYYYIPNIIGDMSQYVISLRSVDALGNVSAAESITLTVDGIPPAQVGALQALWQGEQNWIVISWTNPTDPDLKEVRVTVSGETGINKTYSAGETKMIIENTPSLHKEYAIRVVSADNFGNVSPPVLASVPGNIAFLSDITVNGVSLKDFDSGTYGGYLHILPGQAETALVRGLPGDSKAVLSYDPPQPMDMTPGSSKSVTIDVSSQDGTAQCTYTLSVGRPFVIDAGTAGPGEAFSVNQDYAELFWTGGDETSFVISGTGLSGIRWYVNGVEQDGENSTEFDVSARDYIVRLYTLTVTALKDGLLYSREMHFRILP